MRQSRGLEKTSSTIKSARQKQSGFRISDCLRAGRRAFNDAVRIFYVGAKHRQQRQRHYLFEGGHTFLSRPRAARKIYEMAAAQETGISRKRRVFPAGISLMTLLTDLLVCRRGRWDANKTKSPSDDNNANPNSAKRTLDFDFSGNDPGLVEEYLRGFGGDAPEPNRETQNGQG